MGRTGEADSGVVGPAVVAWTSAVGRRRAPAAERRGECGPALPPHRPPGAPTAFHVLAKPTGAVCNLDCSYCFYLEKESLYPNGRFRMREAVMQAYVRQVLESHRHLPEVTLAWQGGEPTLMGLGFFRRVVEFAETVRRPHQRILHTLQTNATLIDAEWAAFLAEAGFLVGVSVDGPPDLHDVYRRDKRGRPTAERVQRGLGFLRAAGVQYNLLCTVHAANADQPLSVYRYLRDDCGGRFLQFIPIVEHAPEPDDPERVSDRSVRPEQWGRFLNRVFDEWLAHDVGEVVVQGFEAVLATTLGLRPGVCVFEETCGDALALEHNGDVYSCDHFVDPAHRLGNVTETHLLEMVGSDPQRRFGTAKRDRLPQICRSCEVRAFCQGECPRNRFVSAPDGEPGLNYLCPGYLSFFRHVAGPTRLMADLVRSGRPAAEIAGVFARAPRNGPCPCGSGRKAKACHARPT